MANPNSLLFNLMGIGTFLVFFFLVVAVVVWFLSASCTPLEKILARGIFIFVFMVTSLVLVYAPRTQATYSYGYEKTVSVFLTDSMYVFMYVCMCASTICMYVCSNYVFMHAYK